MNKAGFINHIRELVSENKPSEALNILKRLFTDVKDEKLLDEVIILNGRLKENERNKHNNTISNDNYNIEYAKIRESILNLNSHITEIEIISDKGLGKYFRPVKTFPRSYFYQLLTIVISGAIISFILIDRNVSDLKEDLITVSKERDKLQNQLTKIEIQNENSRIKPLVISMDSPNQKWLHENGKDTIYNVYDPRSQEEGKTNSDDIEEAIEDLDLLLMKEVTGEYWDRWEQIRKFDPELILIHYSCFYPNSSLDESGRFSVFLRNIQDSKANILVYSRQDEFKDDEYIRRWINQKENEFPNLNGKIHIFKIFPETDLKVQRERFSSFRHMTTKGELQRKIKELLRLK